MEIKKLKELLSDNENASSIIDAFMDLETDIQDVKSKRQVNLKAKRDLEFQNDALNEIGFNGDIREFVSTIKSKQTQNDRTQVQSASWEEKIDALERKWSDAEAKATKLEKQATSNKITSKLNESLNEKVYNAKYLIESLVNSGRVTEVDGDIVFKDGDEFKSYAKGIDNILEENKDNLKSNQKPGSDTISTSHSVSKKLEELSVNDVMNDIESIAKELGVTI